MDSSIFYKVLWFWLIFYITPGPVWISVMEATRIATWRETFRFFAQVFLPVNLTIQFSQAVLCVFFVEWVSQAFSEIGVVFYVLGGSYIFYLAYKVMKSTQQHGTLNLTLANLAMIMLLSPKIWLLFPSGAVIANQWSDNILSNALLYGVLMLVVSNTMFFFYAWLGKVATKLLKDKFSYLAFGLLFIFGVFLFIEAWSSL